MPKSIKISDNQKIEVSSFKNDQGRFINLRKFYRTTKNPDWKPTRQGITLPEEKALKILRAAKDELNDIDNAPTLKDSND